MAGKQHLFRGDLRIESLRHIIKGLDLSLKLLKKKLDKIHWYDGLWLHEEAEPIIGLAFIAFQNYITISIKDISGHTSNKIDYYNQYENVPGYEKTAIELIVALANFMKHKEEKVLHKPTENTLRSFSLKFGDDVDIIESPIFVGLDILSKNRDLFTVLEIVKNWRERIWEATTIEAMNS